MIDEHHAGLLTESLQPCYKPVLVRVTAHSGQPADFGPNIYFLAKKLDTFCTVV